MLKPIFKILLPRGEMRKTNVLYSSTKFLQKFSLCLSYLSQTNKQTNEFIKRMGITASSLNLTDFDIERKRYLLSRFVL